MTHSASLLLLGFLARPVRVHEFVELVHQALLGGTTGPIRGFLEQDDILKSRPCPLIPRVYMIMKQLMNEAVDELVNQAVNEAFNTAPQLSAVSKPLTTPTSDRIEPRVHDELSRLKSSESMCDRVERTRVLQELIDCGVIIKKEKKKSVRRVKPSPQVVRE